MKRFLLFYGDTYYPLGGWRDFHGSFETFEDADVASLKGEAWDWRHIVDTHEVTQ